MTEVFRRQDGDEVTVLAHLNYPPRKLKATWTVEAEQDLQAWMGSPVAQEFVRTLANQIAEELGLGPIQPTHNWQQEGF